MLDLEQVLGGSLDVLGDLVAVGRAKQQRPQDQHVQRALQQSDSLGRFVRYRHGRHSTQISLNWVDGLPLILVSGEIRKGRSGEYLTNGSDGR